jgi:RecA-family ATPase
MPRKPPTPCLRAALHYAEVFGWKTFPARMEKGKKYSYLSKAHAPEGLNWGMTSDSEQLKRNFSNPAWRDKCGVGLPTGAVNGFFVVEADTLEGHGVDGISALEDLQTRHGKFPDTYMAMSPTGSLHYYFNHPGGKVWQSLSRLADGVDVKGDGNMVIAPPSKRSDGTYEWIHDDDVDLADAPEWLIKLVTVQPSAAAIEHDDDGEIDPFRELARDQMRLDVDELLDELTFPGNVHDTEVRVSASLLSRGEAVDDVVKLLMGEVFERVPQSRKWDRNIELSNIRKCCTDWFKKNPELLDEQHELPPWLRKKLNGHAPPERVDVHDDDIVSAKRTIIERVTSTQLMSEAVEAPTWLVPDLVLEHAVNGFFGDGGTGKDLLMLQLAFAMTNNKTFLGMEVKQGRVIYINTEDSKRHLRWRQHKVMAHYSLAKANDDLLILPMWGKENVLWTTLDSKGQVTPTKLYRLVCKVIEEFKPTLVITANRVNIFAVNQNDDVQARQCLALLDAIVKDHQCTVIMPGHPSLGQIASGSGSSGSVQWSNGCRQRLYLSRVKKSKNEDEAPTLEERDQRVLEVLKSNWGPQGNGIKLRWIDWAFKAEDEDLMIEEMAPEVRRELELERAEEEFLRMLAKAEEQGVAVSAQPTARTNAATMFARNAAFAQCQFRGDSGYRLMAQAMANLFENGAIQNVPFGPVSHGKFRVVLAVE